MIKGSIAEDFACDRSRVESRWAWTRRATVAMCLFIAGSTSAPQGLQAPATPTFRAETSLVLVPFHVRGRNAVANLQASDVVLLEDGKPRDFSIIATPGKRGNMPLELVLLFDTNARAEAKFPTSSNRWLTLWDPADVYRFARGWDERLIPDILGDVSSNIRISVYRCVGRNLYKLYPAGNSAPQIAAAIRGLPKAGASPEPGAGTFLLRMPLNRTQVQQGPFTNDFETSYFMSAEDRGWPMEAAIATLDDVAAAQDKVARLFVMFSQGISATTTVPEDVGNQALDLGIPIYPVALNYRGRIDVDFPRNLFRMEQFKELGKMTGGQSMEHSAVDAKVLKTILEKVKADGLSQYVIGFVPSAGSAAMPHALEVKLAPDVSGHIEGGKRRAMY